MTWSVRTITILLLLAATAIVVAWDIYAVIVMPGGGTVSAVVLDTSQRHPMLPFCLGVIMGHLCWPQPTRKP